jgi:hypothetical protein
MRYRGFDDTRVISVDNDEAWLGLVGEYLRRESLEDRVEVTYARRIPWRPPPRVDAAGDGGWSFDLPDKWYDTAAIRSALAGDRIGMMVVDGPKGRGTITRYPAVAELLDQLDEPCSVILDDAHRPPEQEIISRWESLTSLEFSHQPEVKLAIGRPPRQAAPSNEQTPQSPQPTSE